MWTDEEEPGTERWTSKICHPIDTFRCWSKPNNRNANRNISRHRHIAQFEGNGLVADPPSPAAAALWYVEWNVIWFLCHFDDCLITIRMVNGGCRSHLFSVPERHSKWNFIIGSSRFMPHEVLNSNDLCKLSRKNEPKINKNMAHVMLARVSSHFRFDSKWNRSKLKCI